MHLAPGNATPVPLTTDTTGHKAKCYKEHPQRTRPAWYSPWAETPCPHFPLSLVWGSGDRPLFSKPPGGL